MCDDNACTDRRTFLTGVAGLAAGGTGLAAGGAHAQPTTAAYADPSRPALPPSTMKLDVKRAALVVIDPQIDFMSPRGRSWSIVGESVTEQNMVANLIRLFEASKRAGIVVAISPHYYYPHDHKWDFAAPVEVLQHELGMFDRAGPLTLDGFAGSGAEYLPELKRFIEDGKTIVCSPHKLYSPMANDLVLQLRKKRVDQIILAGMAANLCVESHLRHFLELGFEVAVVRDAIAAAKIPDGDGYLAALVNFRFIANALWTTDDAVARLSKA